MGTRANLAVFGAIAATVAIVSAGLVYDSSRTAVASPDGAASSSTSSQAESFAPRPLQVQRTPKNGPTFVTFLGDSISNSWGASVFEKGYRPLVVGEWQKGGRIDPVVTAVSGATLAEVSAQANIPPASNLVVIELGTNDNGETKTPPDGFRAQYRALIERIHQTAPAASVLCVGTWRSSKDGQELDSIIYDECKGENAKMVSLTDLYEWTDSRGPVGRPIYLGGGVGDNFHPNDAGYSAITKRIVESVQFSE